MTQRAEMLRAMLIREIEWLLAEQQSYRFAVGLWRRFEEVVPGGPNRRP